MTKVKTAALIILVSLVALYSSRLSAQQSKGESLLNKGDSIQVYVDAEDFETLKASRAGAKVKIKVLDNVERYGKKLINKGAVVHGTVIKRGRGGAYGGGGSLRMTLDSTFSNARTMIPLKGTVVMKGKGGGVKTIVSIVLFPVGWLVKGSDIEFPEGKNVYKPVVAEDTPVNYLK